MGHFGVARRAGAVALTAQGVGLLLEGGDEVEAELSAMRTPSAK